MGLPCTTQQRAVGRTCPSGSQEIVVRTTINEILELQFRSGAPSSGGSACLSTFINTQLRFEAGGQTCVIFPSASTSLSPTPSPSARPPNSPAATPSPTASVQRPKVSSGGGIITVAPIAGGVAGALLIVLCIFVNRRRLRRCAKQHRIDEKAMQAAVHKSMSHEQSFASNMRPSTPAMQTSFYRQGTSPFPTSPTHSDSFAYSASPYTVASSGGFDFLPRQGTSSPYVRQGTGYSLPNQGTDNSFGNHGPSPTMRSESNSGQVYFQNYSPTDQYIVRQPSPVAMIQYSGTGNSRSPVQFVDQYAGHHDGSFHFPRQPYPVAESHEEDSKYRF
eukprot:c14195_g1_i3.p1 GENE.c14195_g1_i3~~c14195_g1_i3.p1  ORF type:complete len:333 (+),score=23.75 c14195_g1_i3:1-999(+)